MNFMEDDVTKFKGFMCGAVVVLILGLFFPVLEAWSATPPSAANFDQSPNIQESAPLSMLQGSDACAWTTNGPYGGDIQALEIGRAHV